MRVPVSCMISPTSLLYGPAMKGWKAFSTSSLSTARLSWEEQNELTDKNTLEQQSLPKSQSRPHIYTAPLVRFESGSTLETRLVLGKLQSAGVPTIQRAHLLSRDEKDLMASFLDAFFGASDLDLITGVIWAWDLDFGCSF